jgi:hypothetical protein
MRRSSFIATVGCAAGWPVVARAQVPGIGVLGGVDTEADGPARVKTFPSEAD